MSYVTFTDLRAKLKNHMDFVVDSREPLVVARQGDGRNVVLMSEADFEGWKETVYLLSSPNNAARLFRALKKLDAGEGQERQLLSR
ncbi:MAG: Prevent-host-death protein [Roseomonas sp.]|jgi:antitoxin YefM|nr:Prevent-host-death protein [Roseomonas sp.]